MKHAYLIMAHAYSEVLKTLLMLLDDPRCDIYIHMDQKNRDPMPESFRSAVRHSELVLFSEIPVYWGDTTLMEAGLILLKKALKKGPYAYYHLLSGADLPVKKANEIYDFFDVNQGKEFIHFGTPEYSRDIRSRYTTWHFFERQLGRRRDDPFYNKAETYSQAIQRRLHIDRSKSAGFQFYGGSQWFSVTQGFASYVVENTPRVWKHFRFTQLTEEFFIQSMVMTSPFSDKLYVPGQTNDYRGNVRLIDWNRGTPYVWRKTDLPELLSSEACFARKFDEKADDEVVKELYETLRITG